MLSCLLILSAAFAAAPLPPELPEVLPEGFRLDGDPSEWLDAPALTLGKLQQTGGSEAITGPEDYLLQGWWALTDQGLYIAGEVRDDKPLFATIADNLAASDHVLVWIALPPAELPPLAFLDETGSHALDREERCDTIASIEDKEACRAWVALQAPRRVVLSQLFVRQYALSPLGVNEAFAGSCEPEPIEAHRPGLKPCPDSEFKSRIASNGWTFEARIGREAFPASGELPLRNLRLLVEAVDNDLGQQAQESTMSFWKEAHADDLATLPAFALSNPLVSDTVPPVLGQLLASNPEPGLFYYPSRRLDRAFVLENLAKAEVSAPSTPSPAITRVKLGTLPVAATLGGVHLLVAPDGGVSCDGCAQQRRLVAVQNGDVLGEAPIGGGEIKAVVPRGEGLHIVLAERGSGLQLGLDERHTATVHRLTVLEFDASGVFSEALQEDVIEGVAHLTDETGAPFAVTGLQVQVAADGATLGFSGQRLDATNLPTGPFDPRWAWDAVGEEYTPVGSEAP